MIDWVQATNDTIVHWGAIYSGIVFPTRERVSTYDLLKNTASCPMCRAVGGVCFRCKVPVFMTCVLRVKELEQGGSKQCLDIPELRMFYRAIADRSSPEIVLERLKALLAVAISFRYWLETGTHREVPVAYVDVSRIGISNREGSTGVVGAAEV